MKFLADLLKSVAEKIDPPGMQSHEPVRIPKSPQGMMNYLIDVTFSGITDASSEVSGTVLMDLARKTGHPRWAIMSAIYEAVGFDESDKPFPTHKQIMKAVAHKHRSIGINRGLPEDDQTMRNLADELKKLSNAPKKNPAMPKGKSKKTHSLDLGLSI